MKKKRASAFMATMLLGVLLVSCGDKEGRSSGTECWTSGTPDAYSITMTVDRTARTASCHVVMADSLLLPYLIFDDGETYTYRILSDSTLEVDPMGEFLYRPVSQDEVEVEYNGIMPTDARMINSYTFKKQNRP